MSNPKNPDLFDSGMITAAYILWRVHGDEQSAFEILRHVDQQCLSIETAEDADREMIAEYLKEQAEKKKHQ